MEKKQTLKEMEEAVESAEQYLDDSSHGVIVGYAKASAIGIRYLVKQSKK